MSTRKRRRGRSTGDFNDELDAHIELETQELIEDGMRPDEARSAARRRFGNISAARERFYEAQRAIWFDTLLQDARCAFRSMRRFPIATIVAIASLAAGIGATAATLTIRNAVFRSAPPLYRDPAQLSRLRLANNPAPAALYERWKPTLGAGAGAATTTTALSDVRADQRTVTRPVRGVTGTMFSVLGVNAELGDASALERTDLEAAPAALSYRVWEQLFDKRPDVLGRTFWIDNQPHVVVAVMPERFWLTDMSSPIWRPLDLRNVSPEEPLDVIARRPPGTPRESLDAQLKAITDSYIATLPPDRRRIRQHVAGIEGTPIGQQVALVLPYLLGVSVLLTLLMACANAAILMIAQWTTREHEIAIRASIGAGRGRIIRSLLTESIIVAGCAGLLGAGFTFALRGWIVARGVGDARFYNLSIDTGMLAQVAALTLSAGVLAGVMPAIYETRRLQANPLRAMAGADRVRQRWRHALVVLEVAITVALLVVTSSMVDGYRRAGSADMGFAPRPLIAASIQRRDGVNVEAILARLERVPGVASAAATTAAPYGAIGAQVTASADARGSNGINARQSAIGSEFFETLGVSIRSGRAFTPRDTAATRSAIINEALAQRLVAGGTAVGRTVWIGDTGYDIVGVVANYTTNVSGLEHTNPQIFLPLVREGDAPASMSFLIRAEGDPVPLLQTLRREIREAAPGTDVRRLYTVSQMREIIGQELLVGTAPLFPLITIGLLLTAAGIYGVLAFAVTRRARELAVRVAIGATNRDVIRLIATHTSRLVGIGALIGVGITFGLSRIVRAGGGAGSIYDPQLPAFLLPVLILVAIGLLASWIPSRRALKINPAIVLRTT
jgi:predicted permease